MNLRPAVEPVLLAVVLGVALAWPLRSPSIEHHGEAREGLVVQTIVDRGEWVLPRRNGELPSKPPLFHWLAALAALGLGLSDGALRLPSAVAAWGVVCLTFALGRTSGGRGTGWLAVGALLGMVPFLTAAIEARVDMVFTACCTAALTAFFFWYRGRSSRARVAMYAALCAGVLAKGPVGVVLPALVIVVFLLVEGDRRRLRELWSWPLVAVATLVDLGWYALATAAGGREFLALQLVHENWSRFVGSSDFPRTARGHTLRLPGLLATQYLPWTLALAWYAVRRFQGARTDAMDRFLHVWWLVVLAVFTLGAGKRPVYLLPAAPPIALLAARLLAAFATQEPGSAVTITPSGWRISLVRVAVAIAVFDVGALTTLQLAREARTRRRSLIAFTDQVARLLPGDAPVPAPSIGAHDRMVLAYRLRRSVVREAPAPGVTYLVPAAARVEQWCDGSALLAESGDGARDFALMRAAAPGVSRRRMTTICTTGSETPARDGGVDHATPQEMAGLRPHVLLPLGDPLPVPTL